MTRLRPAVTLRRTLHHVPRDRYRSVTGAELLVALAVLGAAAVVVLVVAGWV